jgi:hypothetical protein
MTGPEPLHVCLDLAPGTQPVRGRLRLPGKPDRGFAGWTELFAALEATLQTSGPGLRRDRDEGSSDARVL